MPAIGGGCCDSRLPRSDEPIPLACWRDGRTGYDAIGIGVALHLCGDQVSKAAADRSVRHLSDDLSDGTWEDAQWAPSACVRV